MPSHPQDSIVHPAVVVGAGHFGLAIAHALQRRGPSVPVIDAAGRVAASWRRRHPQLRLNTHRLLSSLPGLPMPRSAGAFPARDDVIAYLEAYERRLERPVRYDTAVERIDPADGHWRLITSAGPVRAREVIVATGRERVPFVPDWPGRDTWTGELVTADALGDTARYRGRRVLVVGCGTSGADVLNHLAGIDTTALWVAVRHGPAVLPTWLGPLPLQLTAPLMAPMPLRVADLSLRLTERLAVGDLRRHGLPRHPDGAATRLARDGVGPAFDAGFVAALKQRRIHVVPPVVGFRGRYVELAGGQPLEPDVVICATGYRPGLERMVGHLDVLDGRGIPRILDAAGRSPRAGLRFAGMTPRLIGQFPAARREARAIARALGRGPRKAAHPVPAIPAESAGGTAHATRG